MKITMFLFVVLMMLGVFHFAEETSAAPQGEAAAENNRELAPKKSEAGEGESAGEVEMRELAEEEDVGEAEEGPVDEVEGRAGNARAIITGPRIVVRAVRKVFKKPSDSE